jgi:hypothetical protein
MRVWMLAVAVALLIGLAWAILRALLAWITLD